MFLSPMTETIACDLQGKILRPITFYVHTKDTYFLLNKVKCFPRKILILNGHAGCTYNIRHLKKFKGQSI